MNKGNKKLGDGLKKMKEKIAEKKKSGKILEKVTTYLKVRRVSPKATGRAMKHVRLSGIETVPTTDVTLDGIRKACQDHFEKSGICILLESDQGGQIHDIAQLALSKAFCCAFDEEDGEPSTSGNIVSNRSNLPSIPKSIVPSRFPSRFPPSSSSSTIPNKPSLIPKSVLPMSKPVHLPLSALQRLGNTIEPEKEIVNYKIETVDVSSQTFVPAGCVKLLVNKEPFESGGFRHAYRAKVVGASIGGINLFVVKKFTDEVKNLLKIKGESITCATRKEVQVHMTAKNYVDLMNEELDNISDKIRYGQRLNYKRVYYGESGGLNDEPVFIEPFIEGQWIKLINNNGERIDIADFLLGEGIELEAAKDDLFKKAESFVHYTFVRCHKHCCVLDIQGGGYTLSDPEIATCTTADNVFGFGNLNVEAVSNFFSWHQCNNFCEILKIKE